MAMTIAFEVQTTGEDVRVELDFFGTTVADLITKAHQDAGLTGSSDDFVIEYNDQRLSKHRTLEGYTIEHRWGLLGRDTVPVNLIPNPVHI